MADLREELTFEDLVSITAALRKLKPELEGYSCIGVEKPKEGDKNVVFHILPVKNDEEKESSVVMVSADLILELFGGTGNVEKRRLLNG